MTSGYVIERYHDASPPPKDAPPLDCAVCFEEIDHADAALLPLCKHVFHEKCIQGWIVASHKIKKSVECPYCRHPIASSFSKQSPTHIIAPTEASGAVDLVAHWFPQPVHSMFPRTPTAIMVAVERAQLPLQQHGGDDDSGNEKVARVIFVITAIAIMVLVILVLI